MLGTVLFSQRFFPDRANGIGYHDVQLDNCVVLPNLYGAEIDPLDVEDSDEDE